MFRWILFFLAINFSLSSYAADWESVKTQGKVVQRHEAGLVGFKNEIYLMGGRRINPINKLDPKTLSWESLPKTPMEMHHFQPVVWRDKIVIAGAMTGKYPNEKPVENIYFFYPKEKRWEVGPIIPAKRRRGGAGVVIKKNTLYIVGGITNGHRDGYVNWMDSYDLKKDVWTKLPDAPHKRDHFQAVMIGRYIYAAGGRRTSQATREVFNLLVPEVDVYNTKKRTWTTLASNLPTPRAGNSSIAYKGELWVVGGESARPSPAHNEVEIYNPKSKKWRTSSTLKRGRHGTGLAIINGYMWTASGSGNRGGGPELKSTERAKLP